MDPVLNASEKACFITKVQEALRQAGVQYQNYSGHSFRIGVPLQRHKKEFPTQPYKHLAGGTVRHFWCTFGPQGTN